MASYVLLDYVKLPVLPWTNSNCFDLSSKASFSNSCFTMEVLHHLDPVQVVLLIEI